MKPAPGKLETVGEKSRGARQGQNAIADSRQKTQEPEVLLFDLTNDLGEQSNQANAHPEIVSRLHARLEELDAEITQNAPPG